MREKIKRPLKKITAFFSKEQKQIVNTALWLMIPSLLTKITGQLYNLVAASYYGTGATVDPTTGEVIERLGFEHFVIANAIPELITTTLLVGSVGAIIIPILTQCKKKESKEVFFRTYSSIINTTVMVFAAISAILIIFGDVLFPFFLATFIKPVNPLSA